jgi:TPR repeat protein
MGFKRTTEGRVFFQGSSDTANDENIQQPDYKSQHTQLQILSLLKALNERMKISQSERNEMRRELQTYRVLIEDLESKADMSDQAYRDLERKLAGRALSTGEASLAAETLKEMEETRRLLLQLEERAEQAEKSVSTIKSVQKEQLVGYSDIAKRVKETEARQKDIDSKIEETSTQQARLVRKVDKAIEDRARFMRKIERIEETVIQTRDSLNAKAMVLLTDQHAGAQPLLQEGSLADASENLDRLLQQKQREQDRLASLPIWRRPLQIQGTSLAAIGLVVLMAGWVISETQNGNLQALINKKPVQETIAEAPARPQVESVATAIERAPEPETNTAWTVQEDTTAFAEAETSSPAAAQQSAQMQAADDIGTLDLEDDQKIMELLESDPDALAAELNKIEPGTNLAAEVAEKFPATTTESEPIEQASIDPQQQTPAAAPAAQESVAALGDADPSLPENIKQIETQARGGLAEAQHDLAAIYTAGHGGVKQNYERAAFWFRKAADQGIANAAYNLGVLYHQGLGVKADIKQAIKWYETAAKIDHPEAQYNLGIAYIEGIGVSYDPARATRYFENAANAGVMEAAYNLGLIYENGLLGQPKPEEALKWYKKASDQGSPEAKAALEQLAKTMGVSVDDVNRIADTAGKKQASAAPVKAQAKAQPAAAPLAKAPPPPPVEAAVPSAQGSQQATIAQVQEYLMKIGLYPGPADGVIGPLTSDAIRSYQTLNALQADGQPSESLLSHMLTNGG